MHYWRNICSLKTLSLSVHGSLAGSLSWILENPVLYWHLVTQKLFPNLKTALEQVIRELPWWLRGKESACQCRRCGFDPWIRKIPWSRRQQPTPVLLPGKFHGQRSLMGYSPWGCKELDMPEHKSPNMKWGRIEEVHISSLIDRRKKTSTLLMHRVQGTADAS